MKCALFWLALAASCSAQTPVAPPAVRNGGIVNAAGKLPPSLAGGRVAPGSLIEISGFRLSPAATVEIKQGQTAVSLTPVSATESEMVVLLPPSILPGSASLTVLRSGGSSAPQTFQVVEASFGIFTQHGHGWGPARIGLTGPSARPRQTVQLWGTGLGLKPASLRVLVGGKPVKSVRIIARDAGTDLIEIAIPDNAPLGCSVPVQVLTGSAAIPSNIATIPISAGGEPCSDPHNWLRPALAQDPRSGLIALFRAATRLQLDPSHYTESLVDGGFAVFQERPSNEPPGRLLMLPPPGTCVSYAGRVSLGTLQSPSSMVRISVGPTLNAGPAITVRGHGREELIRPEDAPGFTYLSFIGGEGELPRFQDHPPLFDQGDFTIVGQGGADVGAFQTTVTTRPSLVWKNRNGINSVDRSRGVTVEFRRGQPDDLVLVIATNADEDATGVAICVVPPGDNRFQIPPAALGNLPATRSEEGLPTNILAVAALPGRSMQPITMSGIGAAVAMFVTASIRTVVYR